MTKIEPQTGITPAALRSKMRSALREIWRSTSRKKFLEKTRVLHTGEGRSKYDVICSNCDKRMGFSEKAIMTKVNGTKRKKPTLVYQVDHIDGNAPFLSLRDLSAYAESLIYGEMRILCYQCHEKVTRKQKKQITSQLT